MGVKLNKKQAILRMNAILDELTTCKDKDRHEMLIKELEELRPIIDKSKFKEILVKGATVGSLMILTYYLENFKTVIPNKKILSLIPKINLN